MIQMRWTVLLMSVVEGGIDNKTAIAVRCLSWTHLQVLQQIADLMVVSSPTPAHPDSAPILCHALCRVNAE